MMQTVGLNERILETLRGLIEHHSSSRCVAEKMGQAHNYVARILRGETKLRLDVLERILETLGVPHHLFMQMVLAGQPKDSDAVELLRFLSGGRGPDASFLGDVQPTLNALLQMPLADSGDFPTVKAELDRLEELRRSDKEGAEEGLKTLILTLLTDPPVPVPRQLLEDLAMSLAIFGTVQRFMGRPVDSANAFQLAFAVGMRGCSGGVLAHTYWKAAFLVRDYDYAEIAIRFLEQAREYFLRIGEYERCAELFGTRAGFWVQLGEIEKATADYETALERLPIESRLYRQSAYSGLTYCYEQTGELSKALEAAAKAERLHDGKENLALAFMVWNRAKLAAATGEIGLAADIYRRAIGLVAKCSEPIDAALCAIDLAALLAATGEPKALHRLADEMLAWLPAFRGSRIADAVITELIRCAKWGELTDQVMTSARARLEKTRKS